jgi:sphingolipid 4-desaturase/C4-monooxygenase
LNQKQADFQYTDSEEPHRQRTKDILGAHPEIRNLMGRNPFSFVLILLVVSAQLSVAYLLRDQSIWLVLIAAYFFGAFANHSLYVLIHEAAHLLIFRRRSLNFVAGIIADIPNVVPSAVTFRTYHLKHHSFQGHYDLDADLASRWEARLIGDHAPGKAFWELFFPLFQALRPPRMKEIKLMNAWGIANTVIIIALDIIWFVVLGPAAFLYLFLSFLFSIGFHPLGARWIQEHFLVKPPQETYSYYGPLNIVALNVGYHNEHHDFPSVPWNRLPKIRAAAPEFYNTLYYHTSWVRLWFKFIFDRKLSLYSRMVRKNRGGVRLSDEIGDSGE